MTHESIPRYEYDPNLDNQITPVTLDSRVQNHPVHETIDPLREGAMDIVGNVVLAAVFGQVLPNAGIFDEEGAVLSALTTVAVESDRLAA